MRKIVFILGILFLLVACKKEKIDSKGFATMGCYQSYKQNSTPIDLSLYDSVKWFWDNGCMTMEPLVADTSYSNVVVNPNNPYEILYVENISSYATNFLYKYNFCTNKKELIFKGSLLGKRSVAWNSKNKIFLLSSQYIIRMDGDGSDLIALFKAETIPNNLQCSPNGTLLLIGYDDYPNLPINKIYTENGDSVSTLPNQANFLGWYDDTHILTNFNNKVMKVNVFTGEQDLFLTGTYYSYDYKTHHFLKYHDSLEYRKWILVNENGGIISEMPYHYTVGSFRGVKMHPVFGLNNKLIVNLYTNEFYPDKHTPSCQLFSRNRIAIMNEDGTDVRVVNFPE